MLNTRHRDERGETTLTLIVGITVASLVLGTFGLFWLGTERAGRASSSRATQESAAVTVLNRVGRDISEARVVVKDEPDDIVVERRATTGTGPTRATVITRTRYAVIPGTGDDAGTTVFQRQVDQNAAAAYSAATFTPDSTVILGRGVVATKTRFDYATPKGGLPSTPSEIGRVDITYTAETEKGTVDLKSSAALDIAQGGSSTVTPPPPPPPPSVTLPTAVDDTASVAVGASTTASVLGNDTCASGTTPCPAASATVTASNTGGLTVTVNASDQVVVTAPAGYSGAGTVAVPYTLTDSDGSDGAKITVTVGSAPPVSVTPAAVTFSDPCDTASDTYTIPAAQPGVEYRISGVLQTPGTKPATGTVTVAANAASGYTLSGTTSWSRTFSATVCGGPGGAVDARIVAGDTPVRGDGMNKTTITWSGGPLTWTRISGPATAPVFVSGTAASASSGTMVQRVPLGSVFEYSAGSATDTVTQFPMTPIVSAKGSDWNADTVPDSLGNNYVDWSNAVGSNPTYTQIRAYTSVANGGNYGALGSYTAIENASQDQATCPSGFAAPCWRQSARPAGSETIYDVIVYSDCDYEGAKVMAGGVARCPSANYYYLGVDPQADYSNMASMRAYQAPPAGALVYSGGNATADQCFGDSGTTRLVNDLADDTTANHFYHCATGTATANITADGDTGQASGSQFCGYNSNPGACKSRGLLGGAAKFTGRGDGVSQTISLAQSAWGAEDQYQVAACNAGGCTADRTLVVNAFPGPFSVNSYSQGQAQRYSQMKHWYNSSCWSSSCSITNTPRSTFGWSNSAGTGGYYWSLTRTAGFGDSTKNRADVFIGTVTSDSTPVDAATLYNLQVESRVSGLYPRLRKSTSPANRLNTKIYSSPPTASLLQDAAFCNASVNNGWKYGAWFRTSSYINGTNANSYVSGYRWMWWVGKRYGGSSYDTLGQMASQRWLAGSNNPTTWTDPASWTSGGTEYYDNGVVAGATGALQQIITAGPGSDLKVIPPALGGGHFRVEAYATPSLAGSPDFGDLRSGTDGGWSMRSTSDYHSEAIAARATDLTATAVSGCSLSGTADARFQPGATAWYLIARDQVTRKAANGLTAAQGDASPNPAASGYRAWNALS